jgi:hypothetical protein
LTGGDRGWVLTHLRRHHHPAACPSSGATKKRNGARSGRSERPIRAGRRLTIRRGAAAAYRKREVEDEDEEGVHGPAAGGARGRRRVDSPYHTQTPARPPSPNLRWREEGGGRRQAGGELVGVEGWCEMQKCLRCWLGSQAPRYIGSAVLLCDIAMAGPLDRALVLR